MKRIVVALILLLSAISVSVWSNISFENRMEEFSYSLKNLISYSENSNDEKLEEETRKVVDAWHDSSAFLHSLVAHEGMDELEKSITSLPLLLEHSDREEFVDECIKAVNQIENLIDSERLNIGNILIISQDPK